MADGYPLWDGTRSTPATRAENLISAMVSDTADLTNAAKAMLASNNGISMVVMAFIPADQTDPVTVPIPPGFWGVIPISARRILSTGSTGLVAGLAAGDLSIILLTR